MTDKLPIRSTLFVVCGWMFGMFEVTDILSSGKKTVSTFG
jgi:hypothetical protein